MGLSYLILHTVTVLMKIKGLKSCFEHGKGLHYWNEIPIVVMLIINFEIFILIIRNISSKLIPRRVLKYLFFHFKLFFRKLELQ